MAKANNGRNLFNEAIRVQMPALVHLTRLGYIYYGKITEDMAETRYNPDTNILLDVFKKATADEQRDEALALEINEQHQERMAPFTFSACGIAIGEHIEFCCNGNEHTGELCEVVDDKHVKYNGETWSLTALAKHLTGVRSAIACPNISNTRENG